MLRLNEQSAISIRTFPKNSNTTNVKVKRDGFPAPDKSVSQIQIQPMLRLNKDGTTMHRTVPLLFKYNQC